MSANVCENRTESRFTYLQGVFTYKILLIAVVFDVFRELKTRTRLTMRLRNDN